jgi:hypothetical protein
LFHPENENTAIGAGTPTFTPIIPQAASRTNLRAAAPFW